MIATTRIDQARGEHAKSRALQNLALARVCAIYKQNAPRRGAGALFFVVAVVVVSGTTHASCTQGNQNIGTRPAYLVLGFPSKRCGDGMILPVLWVSNDGRIARIFLKYASDRCVATRRPTAFVNAP